MKKSDYTLRGWEKLRREYFRLYDVRRALELSGVEKCSPEFAAARRDEFNARRALRSYGLRLDFPHVFGLED